ncbi:MAG: PTS transporter subunit EIIC [Synergistaceae bacterium]|nr:PTS transporter subunit EIIC [Synergistaceae bacterium]
MMKYLQRIGHSLMLPVACLPAAGILYGIGYWLDPVGWGSNSLTAAFCIKAASAIIDQIPILFALGVSIGMASDNDGTSALAGMVSWLMITTLLSSNAIATYSKIDISQIPAAFGKIQNAFTGILAGIIGASCYNRFKDTQLHDWLAFFSGRRCVAIVTAFVSAMTAVVLYYIWPMIYGVFLNFGITIVNLGPLGAGLYAVLNRALIPLGLHHALNAVFWFDTAGINDLGNFWSGTGTLGVTGQYMTGFFPVMMFGLVAGAFAMYRTAKPEKKQTVKGLLLAGAIASFFTGITEPIEFAFMFLAPGLYLIHAVLTGISAVICAYLPVRCGFNFSAGMIDYILSFKAPMALNPWLIIPIGLVFAVVYYFVFSWAIKKFDLKTPGREDEESENLIVLAHDNFTEMARVILEGLGGFDNLKDYDYCATRIRAEVNDFMLVDERKLKSSGIPGVIRPSKRNVQVVIGPKVQFVFDELKKLIDASK